MLEEKYSELLELFSHSELFELFSYSELVELFSHSEPVELFSHSELVEEGLTKPSLNPSINPFSAFQDLQFQYKSLLSSKA